MLEIKGSEKSRALVLQIQSDKVFKIRGHHSVDKCEKGTSCGFLLFQIKTQSASVL